MSATTSKLPRVLTLDIETSPMLVYTFSLFRPFITIDQIVTPTRMISFAAKWYGKPGVIFYSEFHHGREKMVKAIYDLVNEADIVVHFNGKSFDMPHLRREFKQAGLTPYSPVYEIDLYQVAKHVFEFPSNKLDYVAPALGLGRKVSHEGFMLWRKCLDGDPKAWAKMRTYNKADVTLTEQLYEEVRPYIRSHPHMGLFSGENCCANCGSKHLQRRGEYRTSVRVYQRFQCQACGKWSRGAKSLEGADARGVA